MAAQSADELPQELSAALEEEGDLSEAFTKKLDGVLVCLVCGPLDRFLIGKSHKSHTKHDMRKMTAAERQEEFAMYRAIEADGEVARLKIPDQRRMQSRKSFALAAEARQQERAENKAPSIEDGVLDFGKYSKWILVY